MYPKTETVVVGGPLNREKKKNRKKFRIVTELKIPLDAALGRFKVIYIHFD